MKSAFGPGDTSGNRAGKFANRRRSASVYSSGANRSPVRAGRSACAGFSSGTAWSRMANGDTQPNTNFASRMGVKRVKGNTGSGGCEGPFRAPVGVADRDVGYRAQAGAYAKRQAEIADDDIWPFGIDQCQVVIDVAQKGREVIEWRAMLQDGVRRLMRPGSANQPPGTVQLAVSHWKVGGRASVMSKRVASSSTGEQKRARYMSKGGSLGKKQDFRFRIYHGNLRSWVHMSMLPEQVAIRAGDENS